jgi:heme/copper-type cytochrome/quinol oxidase subunit 2
MADWQPVSSYMPSARSEYPLSENRGLLEPDAGPPDLSEEPGSRPMPEVRAAPSDPNTPKPEHALGRSRFRFRRNPEPLTTIVQVLLVICICITTLELANALVRYNAVAHETPSMSGGTDSLLLPEKPENENASGGGEVSSVAMDGSQATIPSDENDDVGNLLLWAGWIVNLLLVVPYFMWLFRADQNCRNFSFIMRFKPEWAIWCYFIPPMNFFRPLQVMQEIYRVSRNPRTWHNDRLSVLVAVWWTLALATGVLALSSWLHSMEAATPAAQADAELLFVALKVVQAAWYGVFLAMVTVIVQNQMRVVRESRRRAGQEEE